MKRIIIGILAFMALFTAEAGAEKIGDKIGEALYSDVDVYINHYPIRAYSAYGYAAIVAEDLTNYCCDVTWDNASRSLYINKSDTKAEFTSGPVYKSSMPSGSKFADILYSDIKTYVNGHEVTSFTINGYTMIVIDDFGKYMGGYNWDGGNRAAKAWIDGKKITAYAPTEKRTETVFTTDGYGMKNYSDYFDFDFDRADEKVSVMIVGGDDDLSNEYMTVKIGGFSRNVSTYGAVISDVYVCDIDISDGHKDLAVITIEESDDPVIRIFNYDELLTPYKFQEYDDYSGYRVLDEKWIGYAITHYFNVNDDGTITIEGQTPSAGMWSVYKTYARDKYGVFVEVKPDYYEILPDFMQKGGYGVYGSELEMWKKGYVKAHTTLKNNGFTISAGEYFRVLYDNGQNSIYIVKQNGKAGWVKISYDIWQKMYDLNNAYFYMAG